MNYVIPNIFLHATTVYALLRRRSVALEELDFWKDA